MTKKKKLLFQQDNRVIDQRDTLQRLSRNIINLITIELQSQYPTIKQKDKTILHAYDLTNVKDEIIRITDEQLITITGHNEKDPTRNISYFKRLLQGLRKTECMLPIDYNGNRWITVGWINYAERNVDDRSFNVQISNKIIPYILNLAKNYTSLDFLCLNEITNLYAYRIYMKCCQWKATGWFKMTEDEIRETLCIYHIDKSTGKKTTPKYTNPSQFRTKVLEVAKKELKDLYNKGLIDCYFDYFPTKWKRGKQHPYEWVFAVGWDGHEPNFGKMLVDTEKWKAKKKAEKKSKERDLFADYIPDDSSSMDLAMNGIISMLRTYFRREPTLIADVEKTLKRKPKVFTEKIFKRISEMRKKYEGEAFAPCFRKMINEDILGNKASEK